MGNKKTRKSPFKWPFWVLPKHTFQYHGHILEGPRQASSAGQNSQIRPKMLKTRPFNHICDGIDIKGSCVLLISLEYAFLGLRLIRYVKIGGALVIWHRTLYIFSSRFRNSVNKFEAFEEKNTLFVQKHIYVAHRNEQATA